MRYWLYACFSLILFISTAHSSSGEVEQLTDNHNNDSISHALQAIELINKGKYQEALSIQDQDPTINDLIKWLHYKKNPEYAKLSLLKEFAKKHPNWPDMNIILSAIEIKSLEDDDNNSILSWFARKPPSGQYGRIAYAKAQLATNANCTTCIKHLKKAWISGHYSKSEEQKFLAQYGNRLQKSDHNKKIEHLLCHYKSGNYDVAHRISKLASPKYKYLIEAHKQSRTRGQFSQALTKQLPPEMMNYPCILVEKIRWHTKSGNDKKAQQLLFDHTSLNKTAPNAEQLWRFKHIQIRHLIRDKEYDKAYQLSITHGFNSGMHFADATWLSGWIALRFLNDPQKAYKHFETLYKKVSFAASLSRGAYWTARAAEAMDNKALAKEWYNKSSKFTDTYYGQLAQLYNNPDGDIQLPPVAKSLNKDIVNYQNNELVKIAYILLKANKAYEAEKFLRVALSKTRSPGEKTLIAQLPYHLGYKSLGVAMSKRIGYHGFSLPYHMGYPVLSHKEIEDKKHLVHAIIRQESNFDTKVKSSAGAMGIMQVMPRTAEFTAKQMKLPYHKKKLIHEDYNIKLGAQYLQSLLDQHDSSYILSIASYNAGPHKVKDWIEQYGDPRTFNDLDSIVDWVEQISFGETRTYVQRVLSNMQIYKAIMARENNTKDNIPKISNMHHDLASFRHGSKKPLKKNPTFASNSENRVRS